MFRLLLFFMLLSRVISSGCPHGAKYIEELQECIWYSEKAATFDDSIRICNDFGGHLISLHNAFQNAFIAALVLRGHSNWLLLRIGLYRSSPTSSWKWGDGSPTDYFNWAYGEPSNATCASLSLSGFSWKGDDCLTELPYICSFSPSQSSCPPKWEFFETTGACYYSGENMTFAEGERFCGRYGGHLASVHSDAENDFIASLTFSSTCAFSQDWIAGTTLLGGTYNQKDNRTASWSDGSAANYTRFICQNEGTKDNTILLRSFPMNTCKPLNQEWCGGKNWRIGRFAPTDGVRYPNFACKTMPYTHTQCPLGWTYFYATDKCYFHSNAPATFWDAEMFCEAYGGDLVSIHSQIENDFVKDLAWSECGTKEEGFQRGEVLIGGIYSAAKKGIAYWTDGSSGNYLYTTCDLFHVETSTVVMAAHPKDCGGCVNGTWFLPGSSVDDKKVYGEFVCQAPTYTHINSDKIKTL